MSTALSLQSRMKLFNEKMDALVNSAAATTAIQQRLNVIDESRKAWKAANKSSWTTAYGKRLASMDADCWEGVNEAHLALKCMLIDISDLLSGTENEDGELFAHFRLTQPGSFVVENMLRIVLSLDRTNAIFCYSGTWPRPFLDKSLMKLAEYYDFTDCEWYKQLMETLVNVQ